MPSTRTRAPPKKAFGAGGKLSQLKPGSSSGHPLVDDSPRCSRESSPSPSDVAWVEDDAPLEDDEDHAAQNALYDMTRTAEELELTQRDIDLGGVDPRALASPATPRRGRPPGSTKKNHDAASSDSVVGNCLRRALFFEAKQNE